MDRFHLGAYVRKRSGAFWEGAVVGHYSTAQTPDGIAVQLFGWVDGPVQIYPAAALELCDHSNSRLPPPPQTHVDAWQGMETAPKDGRHSIFAIKFGPFVYSIQGTWDAYKQKWINAADREGEYLAWMPNVMLPNEFCPWTDEYKSRAALATTEGKDNG